MVGEVRITELLDERPLWHSFSGFFTPIFSSRRPTTRGPACRYRLSGPRATEQPGAARIAWSLEDYAKKKARRLKWRNPRYGGRCGGGRGRKPGGGGVGNPRSVCD